MACKTENDALESRAWGHKILKLLARLVVSEILQMDHFVTAVEAVTSTIALGANAWAFQLKIRLMNDWPVIGRCCCLQHWIHPCWCSCSTSVELPSADCIWDIISKENKNMNGSQAAACWIRNRAVPVFESGSGHLSHCVIPMSREFTHNCSRSTRPSHPSAGR